MTDYFGGAYDVVVVGAGHAGVEAALASARLGKKDIAYNNQYGRNCADGV